MVLDLTQILFQSEKDGFVNARTTAPITAIRLTQVISLSSGYGGFSDPDSARDAALRELPNKLTKYEANAYEEVSGQSHDSRQECDGAPYSYSMQVIGYRI